jgi:hypothetical protein
VFLGSAGFFKKFVDDEFDKIGFKAFGEPLEPYNIIDFDRTNVTSEYASCRVDGLGVN